MLTVDVCVDRKTAALSSDTWSFRHNWLLTVCPETYNLEWAFGAASHLLIVQPVPAYSPPVVAEVVLNGWICHLNIQRKQRRVMASWGRSIIQWISRTVKVGVCGWRAKDSCHLQFVEAEGKMKDLGELLGQGLLSLQVLHGGVGWASQRLQQAAQGVLCKEIHASEIKPPDSVGIRVCRS